MIVAGLKRPDDDALPLARESAAWLDKYLESGSVGASEAEQAIITLINVGNRFRIEEQFAEALRLTLRAQVVAAAFPEHERHLGSVLISLARIQRDRGALDDAIKSYEQAATILENAHRANGGTAILKNFALALIEPGGAARPGSERESSANSRGGDVVQTRLRNRRRHRASRSR